MTNSSSIAITPVVTNYPAPVVVGNKLTMSGHGSLLNATGVVYAGTGISGLVTNNATNIAINGALLVANGGITSYSGQLSVTYNAAYTNIPISNVGNSASINTVKIISWSE